MDNCDSKGILNEELRVCSWTPSPPSYLWSLTELEAVELLGRVGLGLDAGLELVWVTLG